MRLLLAVLFCSVMLPSAYAEKLPAPTGKPVLTISGKIGNMNVGDKAVFDLAMLEKLGMKTIETTTPWYTGKVRFDGIPLSKLMDLVGAKGPLFIVYPYDSSAELQNQIYYSRSAWQVSKMIIE
ncbi:oxidoreductase [Klebsiella pneumoniae]|nr:oxidoreductase [Klebsiella pneumoniae]